VTRQHRDLGIAGFGRRQHGSTGVPGRPNSVSMNAFLQPLAALDG
jgi:hypothetical protein